MRGEAETDPDSEARARVRDRVRDRVVAEIVQALASRAAAAPVDAERAEQERRRAFLARTTKSWEERCRTIASRGPGRTILLSLLFLAAWAGSAAWLLDGQDNALALLRQVERAGISDVQGLLRPLLAPTLALATLLTALWASYLTALTVARRGAARCGVFERAAGGAMKGLITLAILAGIGWLIWRVIAGALSGEIFCLIVIGIFAFRIFFPPSSTQS